MGKLPRLCVVAVLLGGCGLEADSRFGGPVPSPPAPSLVDGGVPAPPPTTPPPVSPAPPSSPDAGSAPPPKTPSPDADKDGVPDGQDRCSHTPAGAQVWSQGEWAGCASGQLKDTDDGDRDGVANGTDKCPGTAIGVQVYKTGAQAGCPLGNGTPPPQPAPDAGTPGFALSAQEKDLLKALNDARAQSGLPPVAPDAKLTCAARMHATDYAGGCDHTGSDGSWPWDRAKKCGFPQPTMTVNEICAGPGFTSGPEAVWGWKQSSGHWAAIVHTQAKLVGLGVGTNGCYVALFDCCVASF